MRARRLLAALAALVCSTTPLRADQDLAIGGAAIHVHIGSGYRMLTDAQLLGWVERGARALTAYFGRFPVSTLDLDIQIDDRSGPHGGVTRGWPRPRIAIRVGRRCPPAALDHDWVLIHEMVHTSLPNVDRDQHWAEEGLATYAEPIARLRAGQLTREEVWSELASDMPQGDPEAADAGLDHTPTWGRTYWGGAQFWLLADVEIRRRTSGRLGLEDALRGVLAAGGDITVDWPLERVLAAADRAVGVPVLVPLYEQKKAAPSPVDWAALWKQLGVSVEGGRISFDASAPLAAARRAIERGPR